VSGARVTRAAAKSPFVLSLPGAVAADLRA
jgi:hypothetical protein